MGNIGPETIGLLFERHSFLLRDFRGVGPKFLEAAEVLGALGLELCRQETEESAEPSNERLASLARALYRARRSRNRHFRKGLFAEPAWDMLLDLFANAVNGRSLPTTSLCIAGDVPPTTGLRWVQVLEAEGLIARRREASDHRVWLVALTRKGVRGDARLPCDLLREQVLSEPPGPSAKYDNIQAGLRRAAAVGRGLARARTGRRSSPSSVTSTPGTAAC